MLATVSLPLLLKIARHAVFQQHFCTMIIAYLKTRTQGGHTIWRPTHRAYSSCRQSQKVRGNGLTQLSLFAVWAVTNSTSFVSFVRPEDNTLEIKDQGIYGT